MASADPTTRTSDAQLLEAWRATRDRDAMDELVGRHASFVYRTAMRMMRHDAWAEDVTQAVFLTLIQKPPRFVRHDAELATWLQRTTVYTSKNARRTRARRGRHETGAARFDVDRSDPCDRAMSADEARLLPLLNDAIKRLGPRERDGVILRYFQRRTFREIGNAQGVSEDAARKRIGRAVDQMREFFAARCSIGAIVAGCFSSIGRRWRASLTAIKLQTVAAAAGVVLAVCGVAAATLVHRPAALSATARADGQVVQLNDATTLELIGVSIRPATEKSWFTIDGTPIAGNPSGPFASHSSGAPGNRQIVLRLRGPMKTMLDVKVSNADDVNNMAIDSGEEECYWLIPFTPKTKRRSQRAEKSLARSRPRKARSRFQRSSHRRPA